MQCEHGYTKPGVKGILCKKAEEPKCGPVYVSLIDNNIWSPDAYPTSWEVVT